MDEIPYQSYGSVTKSLETEQRQSTNGTNIYCNRGMGEYFELFWFSKLCHVIKYFPELNHNFGQEDIIFGLSSSSKDIEFRNWYLIEL